MNKFWKLGQEFLLTIIWVFIALIVGVALLTFLHTRFGTGPVGATAEWIGTHAEYTG